MCFWLCSNSRGPTRWARATTIYCEGGLREIIDRDDVNIIDEDVKKTVRIHLKSHGVGEGEGILDSHATRGYWVLSRRNVPGIVEGLILVAALDGGDGAVELGDDVVDILKTRGREED